MTATDEGQGHTGADSAPGVPDRFAGAFRAAADASPALFLLVDAGPARSEIPDDFVVTWANRRAQDALGGGDALDGLPLGSLLPDPPRAHTLAGLRDAYSSGLVRDETLAFTDARGSERWFDLQITPFDRGLALSAREVTDDVAERRRATAAEVRLRELVRHSRDVIIVTGGDHRIAYVSEPVEAVTGWHPSELVGTVGLELVHPDDVDAFLVHRAWLEEHPGEPHTIEMRVRDRDGSWHWTEVVAINLHHNPAIGGTVGQFRDITERKRSEAALRASEERFRALAQNSSDLLSIFDEHFRPLYVSPSHETVLGHPMVELSKGPRPDLVHPDDLEAFMDAVTETTAEPGSSVVVGFRFLDAAGAWRNLEAVVTNLLDNTAIVGVVVNARDVTDRVAAEEANRRSEARFQSLVRNSSDVVAVMEPGGRTLYVSPAVERVFAHPTAVVEAHGLPLPLWDDDVPTWRRHVRAVAAHPDGHALFEVRMRHGDGSWRWVEVDCTNLSADAAVGGLVLHLRDVSDRKRAEHELAHQALHDDLTGLPNRALVLDRLEQALVRNVRTGLRTAVLFLDLDRFKVVNDSLGHAHGDALLVEVAARLREHVRTSDTVARLGGDEFVVLLEDLPHESVARLTAEKIVDTMRAPFRLADRDLYVTASVGFAFSEPGATADSMVRDADAAMYQAKGRGRNRFAQFDGAVRDGVLRRLELEHHLHRATHAGEFRLEYQPAFDLPTMAVQGVEALLRWDHPERGELKPGEFVHVAEETGLIVPIGAWVLETACAQARWWRERHPEVPLGTMWVNVSARQLDRPDFVATVAAALERHDLEPGDLGLELTESSLIAEAEAPGDELRAVEALGVRLAIDDFGTGYSSLAYLRRWKVDVLKLDRSFVAGLDQGGTDDAAIARAVIQLGHSLGTLVSAEGVETAEQLRALRELGCDAASGMLLAPPVAPEHLLDVVRSIRSA